MHWRFLVLGISLFNAVNAADLAPCTGEDDAGYYDLSPLKASKDYKFKSEGGRDFTLNVCQGVKSELWNPTEVEKPADIGGFVRAGHGDFSIGAYNTTVRIAQKHPLLVYENGSKCPSATNLRASTVIRFICDPAVFAVGSPVLVAQLPPEDDQACAFFLEWRTHVACPTAKSVGAGGFIAVFGAILLAAILTYIVGATLYNRFVLGYRGLDQLPTVSPLSATALTDCVDFIKDNFGRRDDGWVSSRPNGGGVFGGRSRGGGGQGFRSGNGFGPSGGFGSDSLPPRRDGFESVPQDEHERAPMLDQAFSIGDEEYESRTSAPPEVPRKSPSPNPNVGAEPATTGLGARPGAGGVPQVHIGGGAGVAPQTQNGSLV